MGTCGVLVRSVKREDLGQVSLIELESFESPYPIWYFEVLYVLSNYGEFFLVSIDSENRVDGYLVALRRKGDICHIVSIAVRKDCRRQHVGSALLQSLFEICDYYSPRLYLLEVDMWNMAAQILYVKHGFSYLGIIPNYYGEKRHALLMAKIPAKVLAEKRLY